MTEYPSPPCPVKRGAPTSAPQRAKAGTLTPPITPWCRALGRLPVLEEVE